MKKIKVAPAEKGGRLDKFLTEKLTGYSRSQIQKFIKGNQITVNHKGITPHYRLKEADLIIFTAPGRENKKSALKKGAGSAKKLPSLKIIAETKDYLVVNKPSGLVVHGAGHLKETTLSDLLLKKYPELIGVGDEPERPGIVHRLDKEVSGLMVVARNQTFFDFIKKQFQERKIKKKYTALVYGKVARDQGRIDFPLERSSAGHKMAAKPLGQGGKPAQSEFQVIKRFINYTLLKVEIKTGRTHQIRAHLAAYGSPVVGDNLYGTRLTREKNKKLKTARIFLAADELTFADLAGEKKIFKINLPNEFKKLLMQIK